ncbi:hypothetical protein [Paenibacillus sp. GCM10023250]|uniref:hypothetical protein n=1 Tax=Paenibacillus sp. GCM10023250 TaxID=3252648 RepID=UPI0036113617
MNLRLYKIAAAVPLLLLFIGGLVVWKYDFPKSINLTYPAVEFRPGDPSTVDRTTVTIQGTLHRKLFRNQRFTGSIAIAKYEITKSTLFPVTFYEDLHEGWSSLTYLNGNTKTGAILVPSLLGFGSVWKIGAFESVKLLLTEPVGTGQGIGKDLEVMAPATDYESALALDKLYQELNKK